MEEGHYKGNTKVGVAQLIRDHRGLWAMGGQDLILGYGEIRCGELHCSQIYRPGLRKVAHPCLVRFLVHLRVKILDCCSTTLILKVFAQTVGF